MTKPKIYFIIPSFGALAQLGARLHGMEEVTGSNPVCSTHEKAGKSAGNGFFPCFFILDRDENTALADEKCALAVHDAARTTQNQRSLPRISPIDVSDAPYLDIFRPGVFLKRRFRLTEQLIERNLFLKAIDHRQNISRILREHGAGGIRHGRAENPLVIG